MPYLILNLWINVKLMFKFHLYTFLCKWHYWILLFSLLFFLVMFVNNVFTNLCFINILHQNIWFFNYWRVYIDTGLRSPSFNTPVLYLQWSQLIKGAHLWGIQSSFTALKTLRSTLHSFQAPPSVFIHSPSKGNLPWL